MHSFVPLALDILGGGREGKGRRKKMEERWQHRFHFRQ